MYVSIYFLELLDLFERWV